MSAHFKVGDVVTVREWDDMLEQYGPTHGEHGIECQGTFVTEMRRFCGHNITIERVRDSEVGYYYIEEDCGEFCWSDDMFVIKSRNQGKKYKEGDTVYVRDSSSQPWKKMVFHEYVKGARYKYRVKKSTNERTVLGYIEATPEI